MGVWLDGFIREGQKSTHLTLQAPVSQVHERRQLLLVSDAKEEKLQGEGNHLEEEADLFSVCDAVWKS